MIKKDYLELKLEEKVKKDEKLIIKETQNDKRMKKCEKNWSNFGEF